MAAVRHLGFKKMQFLSCSLCRHAVLLPHKYLAEIGQSVDELWPKSNFQDGCRRHLKF